MPETGGSGSLMLSRKRDQSIMIQGGIRIDIVEVRGGIVKLAVRAPGRRVLRSELATLNDLEELSK